MSLYTINGDTLGNIGNPLRSLFGLETTMLPDSMATLLVEANIHVQDTLTALGEKGADVSSYSGIADLPGIVAAMSGGGEHEVYTGSFTPTEDVTGLPTTQGGVLSFIDTGKTSGPWLYAYWHYGSYPGTYGFIAMIAVKGNDSDYFNLATSNYTTGSSKYSGSGNIWANTSSLVGTQSLFASNSSVKLYSGTTYKWVAIYEAGAL